MCLRTWALVKLLGKKSGGPENPPPLKTYHLFSFRFFGFGRGFFSSRFSSFGGCFFSRGFFSGRFGFRRFFGIDGNLFFASVSPFKRYDTIYTRKKTVVAGPGYVGAGQELGAFLADDDFTRVDELGTEAFDA